MSTAPAPIPERPNPLDIERAALPDQDGAPDAPSDPISAPMTVTNDLPELLAALPPRIRQPLEALPDVSELLEVVMDLGRCPEARFPDRDVVLSTQEVGESDLDYARERVGRFGGDNRAGIERTLHRISAIRNRAGTIVGLTCRVGRAVYGTIDIIRDIVETGQSLLILGRPGIGKTTMLREVARVLADDLGKRVIVVDTSNEIAGDGDIPHPGIGRARRMQVPTPPQQHAVMIEAVENHMPEVIIIDEIGTELEAAAARTIAERGVQLVGTAHGNSLDNLLVNPTLSDLIGGIQPVTLGDEEARRRGTQKTVLERKAPPTFEALVEMHQRQRVHVHHDVAATVDALLRDVPVQVEVRGWNDDGTMTRDYEELAPAAEEYDWPAEQQQRPWRGRRANGSRGRERPPDLLDLERDHDWRAVVGTVGAFEDRDTDDGDAPGASPLRPVRLYPFGINRDRLAQASRALNIPVLLTDDLDEADALMTIKSHFRKQTGLVRQAQARGVPIYVLRSNTVAQMQQSLAAAFRDDSEQPRSPRRQALKETYEAIKRTLSTAEAMELSPQNAPIRRLQHELAARAKLISRSLGQEPNRRVRISSPRSGRR